MTSGAEAIDGTTGQLDAGGETDRLLRSVDWSTTPLGPADGWPQSLRTAVGIILRSRFPMFVFWGPELRQLYNDAYVPVLGSKHPRSYGAPAREIWAEIWDVLGPLVEAVMERGEATWSQDQLLVMDRHGFAEETYFTFSYSPIEDASGVGGVFCACTETTDQVLAARRIRTVRDLAERTRAARSVCGAAEQAVAALASCPEDLPGVALYLVEDQVATRTAVTGFDPDTLAGTVRLDDPTVPDVWRLADVVATGREQVRRDLDEAAGTLPTAPWGEPPREVRVLPIPDPTSDAVAATMVIALSARRLVDDEYDAFVHLVRDNVAKAIADARARQREQERLDALAELNRAKSELLSNVSHEFRTPLTLMLGPLEDALRTEAPVPVPVAGRVHRNAVRLLKLVNSLLDYSRMEAGRLQPSFRPTDLATLTEELASVFRSAVEAAGLRYEVGCAPLSGPVHVDRDLWEKVVLNLLSNALKFTEDGGIRVELRDDDDHVVLEVGDTGVGIAPEHLPHLFDRFYRVENAGGRSHEGSGIGLALVQELVALHGGTVEVDSRPGDGTTFRVRIPVGTRHLPADRLAPPRDRGGSAVIRRAYVAEATSWLTSQDVVTAEMQAIDRLADGGALDAEVLVVDDNADMRRYLAELLSPYWRVRVAADGDHALEALRERVPDLVLSDVMMPRRDGFGLVEAIRSDPELRQVPVLMLSARAAEEAAADGLAAGADDYITKPFTAGQLVARVRANLELSRMRGTVAAERSRGELLAGISHDLQTPLAVVLGALDQLRAGGLAADDRRLLLDRAIARGQHLRLLVQQFLDHATVQSGEPLLVKVAEVTLAPLVHGVLSAIDQRGRTDVAVADGLVALADGDRVSQILACLVGNGLRYSDGRVRITAEQVDHRVRVRVDDDGDGLLPAEQARVFERFYRGDAARGTTGAGLGLYVSRLLAEAQGGALELAGSDGGCRFDLLLPAARPAA